MKWRVDYIEPALKESVLRVIEADAVQFPAGGALVLTSTTCEREPNGLGGEGDFNRTRVVAAFGPRAWIQVWPEKDSMANFTQGGSSRRYLTNGGFQHYYRSDAG